DLIHPAATGRSVDARPVRPRATPRVAACRLAPSPVRLPSMSTEPARTMNVGVLASHEGTTLQSLFDAFVGGRIKGRVAVVVSNNGDSGALQRARQAGVQAVHLSSKTHQD